MRTLALVVLCASCGFRAGQVTDGGGSGSDARHDARIDSPTDVPPSLARRKPIVIQGSKVSGTVTNFPVWLKLVDTDLAHALADHSDVFFTDAAGTALAYEITAWDHAAGKLDAWVKVPQLQSGVDTTIYLRYAGGAGPAANPAMVFSDSFAAVWHLDDSLATTAIADATGTHAGTTNHVQASQAATGTLDGAVQFTGGNDEITFTNPLQGGLSQSSHTISLWVAQTATADNDAWVVLGASNCGEARWLHGRYNNPVVAYGFYCNDQSYTGLNVIGDGWTLVHWVYDAGTNTSTFYRDGSQFGSPYSHTGGSAIGTTGDGGHIGNAPSGFGANMGAHATIDEVRIATVPRSAGWIATEYANQNQPGTFYTVGAEEPVP